MKLNIGCGKNKLKGFINLDISPNVAPDIVRDIERGLPFGDNTFDEVVSSHTLEHIRDLIFVMNEIWRVCKPGALVRLTVPYYKSPNAYRDPTHVRFFTEDSLQYFCGKVDEFSDYGIRCRFELVEQAIIEERELCAMLRAIKPAADGQAKLFKSVQVAEIAELKRDLEARDGYVRALQVSLDEKDAQVQALQAALEEETCTSRALQTSLDERTIETQALQATLMEKTGEAQTLQASLDEETAQAEVQQGELASIKQSLIWRATMKFQSLVERFLPLGTRRRGLYELGLAAIRAIVNEGWRSFIRKVRARLSVRRAAAKNHVLFRDRLVGFRSRVRRLRDLALTTIDIIIHEGWRSFWRQFKVKVRRAGIRRDALLPTRLTHAPAEQPYPEAKRCPTARRYKVLFIENSAGYPSACWREESGSPQGEARAFA